MIKHPKYFVIVFQNRKLLNGLCEVTVITNIVGFNRNSKMLISDFYFASSMTMQSNNLSYFLTIKHPK